MKKIIAVLFSIAAVFLLTSNANAGSFLSFSIGDRGHHSGTSVGFSLNLNDHYTNYGYSVRSYTGNRHYSHNRHYSNHSTHYKGHSPHWNAYNGHDRHHHKSHWKRGHHKSHWKRGHHNNRHQAHWNKGGHGHKRGHYKNNRGHYGKNRGHHGYGHHRGNGHR